MDHNNTGTDDNPVRSPEKSSWTDNRAGWSVTTWNACLEGDQDYQAISVDRVISDNLKYIPGRVTTWQENLKQPIRHLWSRSSPVTLVITGAKIRHHF